jgi:hypothetical protein
VRDRVGPTRQRATLIGAGMIGLLLLSQPIQGLGNVTVANESSYPWLVKGAYADYSWSGVGGGPGFVLENGTVLLDVPPGRLAQTFAGGNSTLDWVVLNRTGNVASLSISFKTAGCGWSFQEYIHGEGCTSFSFGDTIYVEVNVTSRETYVDGSAEGILNFWAPPLLNGGTTYSGTAFVNGTRYDVLADASAIDKTSFAGMPEGGVNVSGAFVKGPYEFYQLVPTTFGTGTNSTVAWLKTTAIFGGNVTYIPIEMPSGSYDYYNGLAYVFSLPQYPISRTVCMIENAKPLDCRYTPYSTTLGTYFRSTGGFVVLRATNIQLGPQSSSSSSTANANGCLFCGQTPLGVALAVVVTIGAATLLVAKLISRSHHGHPKDSTGRTRNIAMIGVVGF